MTRLQYRHRSPDIRQYALWEILSRLRAKGAKPAAYAPARTGELAQKRSECRPRPQRVWDGNQSIRLQKGLKETYRFFQEAMKPERKSSNPGDGSSGIAQSRRYVGKIIFIKKGHRLSLQSHRLKHETIYTDQGSWLLMIGRRKRRMKAGGLRGHPPWDASTGFARLTGDVRLLEVSTPQVQDVSVSG